MSSLRDELIEAKEAKETNINEELGLLEDEIIKEFSTTEEYLLYYSRTGDVDKLKNFFDLLDKEKIDLNINAKGNSKSNRGILKISNYKIQI